MYLKELGFKKIKYAYSKNIGGDYRIMIAFNETGQGRDYYEVVPFITLENKKADAIILELIPDIRNKSYLRRALGYVTKEGQYREWRFTSDNNHTELISEIKHNLVKYGIPYLENIIANPILYGEFWELRSFPDCFYFAPVLYYVAGDIDKCKSYLDRSVKEYYENPELDRYKDPKVISLDYLEFRDKLLQYIEDHK